MTPELLWPLVSLPLLALGLGLWQAALVHERSVLRSLLEILDLLVLVGVIVAVVRFVSRGSLTHHSDYSPAVALAFLAAAPMTSGGGRLSVRAALILSAAFAAALAFVSYPYSFPPLPAGAAMLGVLIVVGGRGAHANISVWPGALAGVLLVLLGLAANDAVNLFARPEAAAHFAINAAAGLVAAAPIAWFSRDARIRLVVAGSVAAALAGWTADALVLAAAAGLFTSIIGVVLERLKIDDATGCTAAFLAAGIAAVLVPTHFDEFTLAGLPGNALLFCAILLSGLVFGFLLALLLQITIGLRAPEGAGEISP